MVGQVGRAQPAALLLQLIQLVLHVVPLLLCHTHLLSLYFTHMFMLQLMQLVLHVIPLLLCHTQLLSLPFTNKRVNAAAHPASVAWGPSLCYATHNCCRITNNRAADAAAHPASVACVVYPHTLHIPMSTNQFCLAHNVVCLVPRIVQLYFDMVPLWLRHAKPQLGGDCDELFVNTLLPQMLLPQMQAVHSVCRACARLYVGSFLGLVMLQHTYSQQMEQAIISAGLSCTSATCA